jgi:hypothetical protein
MSAAPDLNRTPDLAVLGTTTVGYYLAHDLVTTPWKRRLVSLGVLAAGGGTAVATNQVPLPVPQQAGTGAPAATGHGETPAAGAGLRKHLVPVTVGIVAVVVGSWFNARVDRVATGVITRTLGRLPLLGGIFRRLPFTVWGIAQVGAVAVVARLSEQNPAVAADSGATTGAKTPVTSTAKDAK